MAILAPTIQRRGPLFLLGLFASLLGPIPAVGQSARMVTVPALVVSQSGASPMGAINYVAIQLDTDPDLQGPTLIFNELSTLWSGSAVGDTLKEGVRDAVLAAAHVLGEDARSWQITVKNYSSGRFSDGSSASSAIATGIMAAARGDTLGNDVALTGVIAPNGKIGPVGGLVQKLDAAAQAKMRTLLVPKGQAQTDEWDLLAMGQQRRIAVIEVESLAEAYEYMTGRVR